MLSFRTSKKSGGRRRSKPKVVHDHPTRQSSRKPSARRPRPKAGRLKHRKPKRAVLARPGTPARLDISAAADTIGSGGGEPTGASGPTKLPTDVAPWLPPGYLPTNDGPF